ncbi:MAG: glycerol-3-phosphate dehydrogenase, partial [Acetobacteraceae bacterium]
MTESPAVRVDVGPAEQRFDLLVVGGGINGVGIARDAAGRGLRVCLIEQSDLAAFTSSASTKLIHGGLRYLEYYEFRLVREALAERERLLGIAPHLVHPLRFILPHTSALRPRWQLRAGLFLYDHLGGRGRLPGSRSVNLCRNAVGRALKADYRRGFAYSDCWVDDSRLVVANARDAADRGAVVLTHTRLTHARAERGGWHASCRSLSSGETLQMRAAAVVNATGAWVNEVRGRLGLSSVEPIRLVRGSHIVVPRLFEGEHAYILQNPDRRIVFAIPFQDGFTLVGTTDMPHTGGLDSVSITATETDYLCASINRYFKQSIHPQDVIWSYSGVRALREDGATDAAAVTRDYELVLERSAQGAPLLSVLGGKITTYRRLAEAALAKLHPEIGGSTTSWTASAALPGGDMAQPSFTEFVAA